LYYRSHTIKIPFARVFFAINDDLHVDFEKLQMLQCSIYISEKMVGNFLSQSFVLRKGLIKNNRISGNTPMKTHVDSIDGHEVSRKTMQKDLCNFRGSTKIIN
jgi:hypothetical protein